MKTALARRERAQSRRPSAADAFVHREHEQRRCRELLREDADRADDAGDGETPAQQLVGHQRARGHTSGGSDVYASCRVYRGAEAERREMIDAVHAARALNPNVRHS